MLVDAADANRLVDALNTKDYPGNYWLPRVPEDYYTFAGAYILRGSRLRPRAS